MRYHIIAQGRVQGVGFRCFSCLAAQSCGLTGWVKNLSNGEVALEVQGNENGISIFTALLKKGQGRIEVRELHFENIGEISGESGFQIRY